MDKNHPSLIKYSSGELKQIHTPVLDSEQFRKVCRDFGIDDIGFVEIDRPELDSQKRDILNVFPAAKTLISIVSRINRENLRCPARSVASLELKHASQRLESVANKIISYLERIGVKAITPAAGFPMETDQWPGKMQVISHKPVAVAAGLGMMGLHRNVIHPVFGSFILLDTIIMDTPMDLYSQPLDYNPCIDCKLCAVTCPTGAIGVDGFFHPVNCMTHTYRDLLGGFSDWVKSVANSKNFEDYRTMVSDPETISMWQSLSSGPCYKSVYCMAVCPAGDEVIPQYLSNKEKYMADIVRPLQEKVETVYVLPNSDAEQHVLHKFPHKIIKRVGNGIKLRSIQSFLESLPHAFQRDQSKGISAVFHFTFKGEENLQATIIINNRTIEVIAGHQNCADVSIIADSNAWLRALNKESSMVTEIIFRRIKITGPISLMKAFGRCFA